MNVTDYTYLINKPDATQERANGGFGKVVSMSFLIFKVPEPLQIKGLYKQYKYKH
jgi:hypothetical protein